MGCVTPCTAAPAGRGSLAGDKLEGGEHASKTKVDGPEDDRPEDGAEDDRPEDHRAKDGAEVHGPEDDRPEDRAEVDGPSDHGATPHRGAALVARTAGPAA
jgi:hypothetical protein